MATREIVADGFSMPHSPRLHDGRLWLLDSGRGRFGHVDIATGHFEPIAFCPGYARGLSFMGNTAVIGLSLPRDNRTFQGLELDERLAEKNTTPRCGLIFVDLDSGDTLHWVRIEGVVTELYDVAALAGVRMPAAIGFRSDEINRIISIADEQV